MWPTLKLETLKAYMDGRYPVNNTFKLGVGRSTVYILRAPCVGWRALKYKGCLNYNVDPAILELRAWNFTECWRFPLDKHPVTYSTSLESVRIQGIEFKYMTNEKKWVLAKAKEFAPFEERLSSARSRFAFSKDQVSIKSSLRCSDLHNQHALPSYKLSTDNVFAIKEASAVSSLERRQSMTDVDVLSVRSARDAMSLGSDCATINVRTCVSMSSVASEPDVVCFELGGKRSAFIPYSRDLAAPCRSHQADLPGFYTSKSVSDINCNLESSSKASFSFTRPWESKFGSKASVVGQSTDSTPLSLPTSTSHFSESIEIRHPFSLTRPWENKLPLRSESALSESLGVESHALVPIDSIPTPVWSSVGDEAMSSLVVRELTSKALVDSTLPAAAQSGVLESLVLFSPDTLFNLCCWVPFIYEVASIWPRGFGI